MAYHFFKKIAHFSAFLCIYRTMTDKEKKIIKNNKYQTYVRERESYQGHQTTLRFPWKHSVPRGCRPAPGSVSCQSCISTWKTKAETVHYIHTCMIDIVNSSIQL